MRRSILILAGAACSAAWLWLLVATGFAPPAVSVGLLAMLLATGSTANTSR